MDLTAGASIGAPVQVGAEISSLAISQDLATLAVGVRGGAIWLYRLAGLEGIRWSAAAAAGGAERGGDAAGEAAAAPPESASTPEAADDDSDAQPRGGGGDAGLRRGDEDEGDLHGIRGDDLTRGLIVHHNVVVHLIRSSEDGIHHTLGVAIGVDIGFRVHSQ